MPKQQNPNPNPHWDPDQTIERQPVRERDPVHEDDANDKRMPGRDRHRDPLRQPTDVPDVQPDVMAVRRRRNDSEEHSAAQSADRSRPHSSQRRKQ
jgi:hypothetical protein